MIFIVCGGRDYHNRQMVYRGLDHYHAKYGISLIVEGGAEGADKAARLWAIKNHVPFETVEADWNDIDVPGAVVRTHNDGTMYNAAAGGMRNQQMIDDYTPDGLIYFPGGSGTENMKQKAIKHQLLYLNGTNLE